MIAWPADHLLDDLFIDSMRLLSYLIPAQLSHRMSSGLADFLALAWVLQKIHKGCRQLARIPWIDKISVLAVLDEFRQSTHRCDDNRASDCHRLNYC